MDDPGQQFFCVFRAMEQGGSVNLPVNPFRVSGKVEISLAVSIFSFSSEIHG